MKDASGNCQGKNQGSLIFGNTVGATGGQVTNVLKDLQDCWAAGSNNIICGEDSDGHPITRPVPIDSDDDGIPDIPWEVTLPVILCPSNNVENCPLVVGAATVHLVWTPPKGNVDWDQAPSKMHLGLPDLSTAGCSGSILSEDYGDFWPDDVETSEGSGDSILNTAINQPYGPPDPLGNVLSVLDIMMEAFSDDNLFDQVEQKLDKEYGDDVWKNMTLGQLFYDGAGKVINASDEGAVRWASFVKTFAMKNVDEKFAPYQDGGIYFLPSCDMHEPAGDSGGENYGIIADRPVLVYHELHHDVTLLSPSP